MNDEATTPPRPQDTDWYKTRPAAVQRRIDAYPPGVTYRLRTTGQIVHLYSYGVDEQGACNTCTVTILPDENPGMFVVRQVFGISFDDLEPKETAS